MSRGPISEFFRKLFVVRIGAGEDRRNLIALRFKTDVARSISRVVALATSTSRKVQVRASGQPAESGGFPATPPVAAPSLDAGSTPPWLQKLVERCPVEKLNQLLARMPSALEAERPVQETGHSIVVGDDFDRAIAELVRELELRAGLIREQWAIRGPGLLAALNRQEEFQLPAGEFVIELVLPLTGGAAGVDDSGKAWMEALLHDVSFQFPETLRVAWLVALIGCTSEDAAVRTLLNAAAEVDWLSADPATETELRRWLACGSAKFSGESPRKAASGSPPE